MEKKQKTRLGAALSRLKTAVDALETASVSFDDDGAAGRMAEELAAVRSDYEALQLTSQDASRRIDAAIGKLKATLET